MKTSTLPDRQLTGQQLKQLQEDGYCITDVLFDAKTLADLSEEFMRLWQERIEEARQSKNTRDLEFAQTRALINSLYKKSEICAAFLKHPALVSMAHQILGGPDLNMGWDQAIIKPPGQGKALGWHQDAYYAAHNDFAKDTKLDDLINPKRSITFWIAVTRTVVDNGTLWVVPGMHRQGLLPHVWDDAQRDWQGQFDTSWKVPAVLKPGQAVVFTNCTPHWSGPNISDEVRMAYQIGYSLPGLVNNDKFPGIPVLRKNEAV